MVQGELAKEGLMEHCEIHLCCLGSGVFVQLLPHEEPLCQQAPSDTDTTPVIIGSLTPNESCTLTIILREGIGTKPQHTMPPTTQPSVSAGSPGQLDCVAAEMSLSRPATLSRTCVEKLYMRNH